MPRPVTYDEGAVVDAALEQFWAEGFHRSSVDTLVAGTGLNKHSLYQTFGGKDGLFARVLQRYLDQYSHRYLAIFEHKRGLAALRSYFDAVLRQSNARGCLIVNTAVERGASDPECRRVMTDYYKRLGACFARAVRQGQDDGAIRAELSARDTARWLVLAVQGLAVGSRLGAPMPTTRSLLALLIPPSTR